MPRLMNDAEMETLNIPGMGNFQFSATRLENLGASEYTLASIIVDISASVSPFRDELLEMVKTIVTACKGSPRAENLMIRLLTFNDDLEEVHGFKLLNSIDINNYHGFNPDGCTALYDASYSGIGATLTYAKTLVDQGFSVNGCVYIITDGMDNRSTMTPGEIKKQIQQSRQQEVIESLLTVLIGLNSHEAGAYLDKFKNISELSAFIDVGDATPEKIAKLSMFISSSAQSCSMAIGTGTPGQQSLSL